MPTKPSLASAFALCRQIEPAWKDLEVSQASWRKLCSSSNAVYMVTVDADVQPRSFIYRVFGATEIIDVAQERLISKRLSEQGAIPRVLYLDQEQSIEEYLESFSTLDRHDIADPTKILLITEQLRNLHSQDLSSVADPQTSNLLKYGERWRSMMLTQFADEEFASESDWMTFKGLQGQLGDLVFSHCDTTELNVMYSSSLNELRLIDFEYSGYAPRSTDMSFIINELQISYEVNEPPYFAYYPEDEITDDLVAQYVRAYGGGASLWVELKISLVTAHYFWAMWAAAKAIKGESGGFDYLAYARFRFGLFKSGLDKLQLHSLREQAQLLLGNTA